MKNFIEILQKMCYQVLSSNLREVQATLHNVRGPDARLYRLTKLIRNFFLQSIK